ncbi:MAG: aminotransferase class V-fold PLP-dependent enzyme [Thermoguttaceae bacterium]|jgi:cysteine desulfurase
MTNEIIYIDNNATTAIAPEVFDAMKPYLQTEYYNPSSLYESAETVQKALRRARATVADRLGCMPEEVLFTSCATESNNAAIFGAAAANPQRKHIITSRVEHPAVLEVCRELGRRGYKISEIPVDIAGNLDISEFVRAVTPGETLLVSLMHANNETGVIFPIERLVRIVKQVDPAILFHTDATQSVTKLPIDLSGGFGLVDFLSFSGHKIHAPKGVGVLFIRRGAPIRPFLYGGHQEFGRRGGTENIPYIIGLAKAMELAAATHPEDVARIALLRDRLEEGIVSTIPHVEVNGRGAPRMPNTLSIACHSIEGEGILYSLNGHKICASSGSACTSGSLDPSHVLTAMQVPFMAIQGSVRFSLSRYTTEKEIDRVLEVFPEIVANLRAISPYWDKEKNEPAGFENGTEAGMSQKKRKGL